MVVALQFGMLRPLPMPLSLGGLFSVLAGTALQLGISQEKVRHV